MEANETLNNEQIAPNKDKTQGVGVPYPIATIDDILSDAKKIVDEVGTSKPISKEEISRILGKKVNSLVLFYSTIVQYGIFTLVHGKGYLPTDLYRRYTQPGFDNDEVKAKLEMFSSPPLYAKIIQLLNNHQLPSDERRFANILKDEPYKVNQNSAERAAKIFFENARLLALIDRSNKFLYSSSIVTKEKTHHHNGAPEDHTPKPENFKLPIPLPNNRTVTLEYPKKLTTKDIRIIVKALDFVANTSIISDHDDSEIEIEITIKETKKEQPVGHSST